MPLPEVLSSRRHRAAAGVGLAVVAALTTAATFAPAPTAARTVAAAPVAATYSFGAGGDTDPAGADVPGAVTTATSTLPPATAATASPRPNGPAITALAALGIPIVALAAYEKAAALQAVRAPSCRLSWTLVAAIGAVESGHGTHAGARLYADGQDLPHVIGPVLDGTAGNARIADTDGGRFDGDKVFDRAVGPMQFIPSTWARIGQDGNGDGKRDPFNIFDAAAATGEYLCRAGGDLATDAGRKVAVFSYNHLDSYVALVLGIDAAYAGRPVPVISTAPPAAPPTSAAPTAPVAPKPSASRPASPTPTRTPTTPVQPTRPSTPVPTPTPTCPTGTPTSAPTATPTPTPSGCPTTTSAPSTSAAPTTSPVPSSAEPSAAGTGSEPSPAAASATPTPSD